MRNQSLVSTDIRRMMCHQTAAIRLADWDRDLALAYSRMK